MTKSESPTSPISTTEQSDKPPLLFIHGFRGNHLGLADIANAFKPGYDVHMPDLPPVGEQRLTHYTADAYAEWVANYILEHHLDHPILIGHSLGSIIVAATAAKYPELVNTKLVFLAPISQRPARWFSWLTPFVVIFPKRLASWVTTRYLFVPKDRPLFRQTLKTTNLCAAKFSSRLDLAKAAHFSALHCISDFDFDGSHALFIAGETDRLNSEIQTRAAAQKYGSEVIFLEGCGHLLNYECPDRTATAIRNFLDPKAASGAQK